MAPITDLVKKVIDDIRVEDGYAMILDNAPGASRHRLGRQESRHHRSRRVAAARRRRPAKVKAQETAATKGAPPAPAGVTRPPTKPPTQ